MRFEAHSDRAPLARYGTPFDDCYKRRGSAAVQGEEVAGNKSYHRWRNKRARGARSDHVRRPTYNFQRKAPASCRKI